MALQKFQSNHAILFANIRILVDTAILENLSIEPYARARMSESM